MPRSLDTVAIRRLNKGHVDKFWKADLRGQTLSTTVGDFGGDGKTTTNTYPTPSDAYRALMEDQADKMTRGYLVISQEELDSLQKQAVQSGTKRDALPATSAPETLAPPKVISSRKPHLSRDQKAPVVTEAPSGRNIKREGPFSDAFTGESIHRLRFTRPKSNTSEAPPRATSGGQAIMSVGQPWPICTYCEKPLALYLQFDVEESHELAFAPGSHLLLFYCLEDHSPPIFTGERLPETWLDPNHRSSYRIILNPPGIEEAIYEPDPTVLEQHVSFTSGKEKLVRGLDGPIGQPKVKVGGIPHWVQPPWYPTCACGAAMGFILQVPAGESPGWKSTDGSKLPFGGGLSGYLFACTAQSSPYATALIIEN